MLPSSIIYKADHVNYTDTSGCVIIKNADCQGDVYVDTLDTTDIFAAPMPYGYNEVIYRSGVNTENDYFTDTLNR